MPNLKKELYLESWFNSVVIVYLMNLRNERDVLLVQELEIHENNTSTELVGVLQSKHAKKAIKYIDKIINWKMTIEEDVHTTPEKRLEKFLDRKSTAYIQALIDYIDQELTNIYDPLVDIPKNHIDSYQRALQQIITKEEQYLRVKDSLWAYILE